MPTRPANELVDPYVVNAGRIRNGGIHECVLILAAHPPAIALRSAVVSRNATTNGSSGIRDISGPESAASMAPAAPAAFPGASCILKLVDFFRVLVDFEELFRMSVLF